MMKSVFVPFADDASSYTVDELTLENNGDYLSVYGNAQFYADQNGLRRLCELQTLINQAVAYLQAQNDLPETLPVNDNSTQIDNPFL